MDEMERIQQWQYYISSYTRIEHTEGIVRSRLQKPLLERNLPPDVKESSDDSEAHKPIHAQEGLVVRICLNSYKMVFEKDTSDCFLYNRESFDSQEDRKFHEEKQVFQTELRNDHLKDKLITNNLWMRGLSHEEVQKMKDDYQRFTEGELSSPGEERQGEKEAGDVRMTD